MENVTLGEIVMAIGIISTIGTFIIGIIVKLSKWWKSKITDRFTNIDDRFEKVEERLDDVERKRDEYEKEVLNSKAEREILLRGELAALKGLKEMGVNKAVTHSIDEIEDYIMKKSHD